MDIGLFDEARYRELKDYAALSPARAAVGHFRTATAGWTDPSLLKGGLFYPKSAKTAEARLRYYAERFSFVEVDATYYTIVSERVVETWRDHTPEDFRFHFKAHPVLTGHALDVARLPADLRAGVEKFAYDRPRLFPRDVPIELANELKVRFFSSLAPLRSVGRLAGILLQFPPWFEATRGAVRTIEQFRERYPDEAFSVEFRNRTWFEKARFPRVLDLLREARMTYVAVDEPESVTGIPFAPEVTTELGLVRLHGRNVGGWAKKGSTVSERFNYLYSKEELLEIARRLRPLESEAKEIHVVFNNCARDFAVVGAAALAKAFEDELGQPSAPLTREELDS